MINYNEKARFIQKRLSKYCAIGVNDGKVLGIRTDLYDGYLEKLKKYDWYLEDFKEINKLLTFIYQKGDSGLWEKSIIPYANDFSLEELLEWNAQHINFIKKYDKGDRRYCTYRETLQGYVNLYFRMMIEVLFEECIELFKEDEQVECI